MEILLIPICFFIDQYTKNEALKKYSSIKRAEKLNGLINFRIVYNDGAFLGILQKKKKLLLAINILSLLLLMFVMVFLIMIKSLTILKLGISLMLGGAFGNIYDRVRRDKVVDFFSFKIRPNLYFNLADMFVFLGSLLIILGYLMAE